MIIQSNFHLRLFSTGEQNRAKILSETLTVNPEILPRTTHFDRLGEFEFRHISGWPVDPVYCGVPISAVFL